MGNKKEQVESSPIERGARYRDYKWLPLKTDAMTIWALGLPCDKEQMIMNIIAQVARQPDGSWRWRTSADLGGFLGSEPSRDTAINAAVSAII